MSDNHFQIIVGKDVGADEYASLMAAVGWAEGSSYSVEQIERSISAYPFVAVARDANGGLQGYVSAFSDGAFSTFLGELVVRPSHQGQGLGRKLLDAVESYAGGIPVYAKPFVDTEEFFRKQGYRHASRQMSVMFKATAAVRAQQCTAADAETAAWFPHG